MKGKILLLAMFALSFQVFSQVKTEKVNPDQIPQRIQKEGMRPISLTIPDEEVVLLELEESVLGANSENESFDFGRFFPFELNFEIIESLCKDGKCFKEIEVEYGGMNTLGFVFDQLDLSKNAKFYLINDEAGYIQGPITRESVNVPRGFISGLMPGDRLRLLLEEPENEQNTSIIRINEASFGIFDFFNVSKYSSRLNSSNPCWGFGCSASCNINIACTSSLDLESKAVALVLIKNPSNNTYSIRGTGALINNGYQDRKFLFITASHIYNSFEWDNNSQFVFHYKSLQCSPTTNGSLTIYVQGATNIIPTGQGHTDLKLVELKVGSGGNPLFASNPVSFLGWSIIDELSVVQGIHHPRGDVQKLFTGTNVQVYNETIGTGNYNYWKFDLASGVFEAVSSGSPILNVSKRLISTIRGRVGGTPEFSCGGANENAIGGRISASWPAFCQFLDPGNEGIVAINTIPYSSGTSVKVFPSATGPNNVCTSGSFTLTNAPLDIPISWEIIQGANLFSGSTSGSGKTATLNVLNQSVYGSARIRFTIQAMCGVKQYIKNFTVGKPNTTAGINGGTLVYSGSQVVYSISPVSGATSYNWQLPSGWSGGGNGLSNSITATVGSTSGNVTVIPVNSCGQGQPVILYVTVTSCQYCREYTLSPNPANEYLSIIPEDPKFGNKELFHLKEYQIFDMNGKLLQSSSTDMMIAPDQIKVADLPKGLYLVYLIFDDGVLVKKVIIDR